LFAVAGIYVCVFTLQELVRRYWYVCGELKRALVNDGISYGTQLPVVLLCSLLPNFDAAIAFHAMSLTSLLALGHAWVCLRDGPRVFVSMREAMDEHWKVGGTWFLLGTLSAYGALQLYPYMLAALGPAAVASFAAARNLLNALNVLAQATNNYLPIAAKRMLDYVGAAALSSYLSRIALGMAVLATLFCSTIAWGGGDLLQWVYGKSFDGAALLLPLFAPLGLAIVLFPVVTAGVVVVQQTHVVFVSNVVATVFNLTVGWWLIRQHGVNGAALAASVSALLVLAIQSWRLKVAFGNSRARRFFNGKPCIS